MAPVCVYACVCSCVNIRKVLDVDQKGRVPRPLHCGVNCSELRVVTSPWKEAISGLYVWPSNLSTPMPPQYPWGGGGGGGGGKRGINTTS